MDVRRLGKTGIEISPIGLGCWQFSQGKGLVGRMWATLDQATIDGVVAAALGAGVTWFDTAQSYGNGASERALSAALQHLDVEPGRRLSHLLQDGDDIHRGAARDGDRQKLHRGGALVAGAAGRVHGEAVSAARDRLEPETGLPGERCVEAVRHRFLRKAAASRRSLAGGSGEQGGKQHEEQETGGQELDAAGPDALANISSDHAHLPTRRH